MPASRSKRCCAVSTSLREVALAPPRGRIQMVNSLAYCAQAIAAEVQAMVDAKEGGAPAKSAIAAPPFSLEEVRGYIAA